MKKFIAANMEIMKVQQKSEQEMVAAIEGEGLDIDTFNELMQKMQAGEASPAKSEKEQEKFDTPLQTVMKVQQGMQQKVMTVIQEEELNPALFQEMMMAYQTYPEFKNKVDALMEE